MRQAKNPESLLPTLRRRSFLAGVAAGLSSSQLIGQPEKPRLNVKKLLAFNDQDRQIWEEELNDFVPDRVYDTHAHLSLDKFNLNPKKSKPSADDLPWRILEREATLARLVECDAVLLPGREVTYLASPMPHRHCDFNRTNEFAAGEALAKPGTTVQMVVHPKMTAKEVEQAVVKHRFVGFKPYRHYALSGDAAECRIPEFMPEHQLEVANRYGLIIRLHISKSRAMADPENIEDLERLTEKFPRVRWVLAHCARTYSDWPLEKYGQRLSQLPNIWYDTSSVCESAAFDALFSVSRHDQVCYGSDDIPVGIVRGKYVAFGYCWSQLDEGNQSVNVSHCTSGFTFVRYEMLRAMRRAARNAKLTKAQIEDIFYNNANSLVKAAQADLERAL